MKKELIKLANHLDRIGKIKEADFIDKLLSKFSSELEAGGTYNFDTRQLYILIENEILNNYFNQKFKKIKEVVEDEDLILNILPTQDNFYPAEVEFKYNQSNDSFDITVVYAVEYTSEELLKVKDMINQYKDLTESELINMGVGPYELIDMEKSIMSENSDKFISAVSNLENNCCDKATNTSFMLQSAIKITMNNVQWKKLTDQIKYAIMRL